MTQSVGAFEAKTKFSELLDRVEKGEEVIITRRGKPVARMTLPVEVRAEKGATVDDLLAIGRSIDHLVEGEFTSADVNTILYDEDGLPR
ncbi:type II toxin-antitoxin system Phd/YefM family antitoxin [Bauldia litoralis]|uniref:type II toxin-antitoxin system Phd/YefM family antitoxin n=1 Tax=Bauldia litoralis TaxID=665467 RepID=UPI0032659CB0